MLDTQLLSHTTWAMFNISRNCQVLSKISVGFIYFSELIGVTLNNKIIHISDAQFHDTSQVSIALWVYYTSLVLPW